MEQPPGFPETAAGDNFCSATAPVSQRNFLKIKELESHTSPACSGLKAAQFPQFSEVSKTLGLPNVSNVLN